MKMKLAIYDFDGTYVNVTTLTKTYKLWKTQGLNPQSHQKYWGRIMRRYVLHKLHMFGWNKRRFNPYTMEKTANLFRTIPRDVLDKFLQDNYSMLQEFVTDRMRTQLRKDKEAGYHTVLLSGNLDIILEPFRQDGFDSIIGTTSQKDGRLMSSDEVDIIIQEKKAEAIKTHFPEAILQESKAYADNGYDINILSMVGHPTAVNPDKTLRKHALAHDWDIIEIKK